ncbi:MAG: hypothetical protein HC804_04340 [Anaerolineae bacterium]|nr:hypothetical protein [Anaerolineae bacterium]
MVVVLIVLAVLSAAVLLIWGQRSVTAVSNTAPVQAQGVAAAPEELNANATPAISAAVPTLPHRNAHPLCTRQTNCGQFGRSTTSHLDGDTHAHTHSYAHPYLGTHLCQQQWQ